MRVSSHRRVEDGEDLVAGGSLEFVTRFLGSDDYLADRVAEY